MGYEMAQNGVEMTVAAHTHVSSLISDVASIRRQFPIFASRKLHYLDSAATAQMPSAVFRAIEAFDLGMRANVYGGVYKIARDALAAYEQSRVAAARYLDANAVSEVVFTYGTTSAINLVAASFGERLAAGDEIVISALEHHSNTLPWRALALRRGVKIKVLPITSDGRLDLAALPNVVTPRCKLIAITHCSNVTGALTDVRAIVEAARSFGATVLLDGAQRAPHGPLSVRDLGGRFLRFFGSQDVRPDGNRRAVGAAGTARVHATVHGRRADDPARQRRYSRIRRSAATVRSGHSPDRSSDRVGRRNSLDGNLGLAGGGRARSDADATCARRLGGHAGCTDRRTAYDKEQNRSHLVHSRRDDVRGDLPIHGPVRCSAPPRTSLRPAFDARAGT